MGRPSNERSSDGTSHRAGPAKGGPPPTEFTHDRDGCAAQGDGDALPDTARYPPRHLEVTNLPLTSAAALECRGTQATTDYEMHMVAIKARLAQNSEDHEAKRSKPRPGRSNVGCDSLVPRPTWATKVSSGQGCPVRRPDKTGMIYCVNSISSHL
jgi:hypothetical protein